MATESTTSPMLAGPFGDCCFTAFKHHEGDPVGRIENIADFNTYISEPPASATQTGPKKVILYLSDIWGPFMNTTKLLQDFYAANGFIVLGLDYFFGEWVYEYDDVPNFDRIKWALKKLEYARKVAPKWFDEVMKIYGAEAKYFAVGYCFGGPFTLDLAATDKITAAAFAHPAFLNEDQFKKVKRPLLMSCAETDHTFPTPSRHRAEAILAEAKATYHVQVFSGVQHGFSRGDPSDDNIRWARQRSSESIVSWFKRFADL